MQQNPFFIVAAIVSVLFGLAFLFIPDAVAGWYGIAVTDASRLMAQFCGSSLIALAIVVHMARDLGASSALTGILWAGLVTNVIDVVLGLWSIFAGTVNGLGWVTVIICLLLALGFAYFLFVKPAQATSPASGTTG